MMSLPQRTFRHQMLFALLFFMLATTSHAQQPAATIVLAPTTIEVGMGETVDVAVRVEEAQELYGFDLSLTLNNMQSIEIVDAEPNTEGTQIGFGTFLDSGFSLLNQVDQTTGTIRFAMTQVNPSEPKTGSGTIVVITLRGLEVGASAELAVTSAELGQPRGVTFAGNINPSPLQISVVEATTQATPIPKQNTTDAGVSEALGTPVLPTNSDKANSKSEDNSEMMMLIAVGGGIIILLLMVVIVLMIRLKRRERL